MWIRPGWMDFVLRSHGPLERFLFGEVGEEAALRDCNDTAELKAYWPFRIFRYSSSAFSSSSRRYCLYWKSHRRAWSSGT